MKFLSLCSGIDAASIASAPLGWECVGFSEIEPFPCAVLAYRYPSVTNFGDMTKFSEWPEQLFIDADAIVGGPPCQAFSMAGKREGLDDARGNLTLIYANLIDHADRIRAAHGKSPVWCLYENVPGLLSDRTNAFGCLLGKLAGEDVPLLPTGGKWTNAGFVSGPSRAIAWRILDAQYFGVAQRRRRVFVVASAGAVDPAKVLFESEGVRRDSAPSREAGKGIAPVAGTLSANGGGTTRPAGNANELDFCAVGFYSQRKAESMAPMDNLSPCLVNGTNPGFQNGVMTYRWQNNDAGIVPDDVAATIKAKGTTTDERSVGAIVCAAHGQANAETRTDGATPTLTCNHEAPIVAHAESPAATLCSNGDAHSGFRDEHGLVAETYALQNPTMVNKEQGGTGISEANAPMYTLEAQREHGVAHCVGVDCYNASVTGDGAATFGANSGGTNNAGPKVLDRMAVRRLVPEECETLQGFPRGFTRIPWKNKPAEECPDGPRYKALGNSWAVPCARWIFNRVPHA